jgi:uncharacterized protein DUF6916
MREAAVDLRRVTYMLETFTAATFSPHLHDRFQLEADGAFELFLVPLGPDEAGMRYEAVFT